ncbi:MAG: hypothetical protein V4633_12665 [Pseudomonadota bacterium]
MPLRLLASCAAALLLSACATPYQSAGLTGGHIDQKGAARLEPVIFAANGFTSSDIAQQYALYRCAEMAKSRNKPFFLLYSSLLAAAHEQPSTMPRVGTVQNKPVATAFILMLDGPHRGAHNTQDVMEDLAQVIATGSTEKK